MLKRNNVKGFLLRTWVISFLIFSGVVALMFLTVTDLANDYSRSELIREDFGDRYDTFNETSSEYGSIYQGIGDGANSGFLSIVFETDGIFSGMIQTVKVTFKSVGIVSDVISNFMMDFGVPESIANVTLSLILMIIMVILIFVVLSSLRGGSKI